MSLHTTDALEGFAELLKSVGVDLLWQDETFRAVLTTEQPSPQPYALTPGDDETVRVSALRSVFPELPAIGDYFEDDSGTRYRIKRRRQRPGQPVVRFSCEVSQL
jgi:hypothetical protein